MLCHEIIKNHIDNKATFLHQHKIVPISFPEKFNPLITTAYWCPTRELLSLQPSYHAAQVHLKWMRFLESFPSRQIQNEGLNYLSSFCLFVPLSCCKKMFIIKSIKSAQYYHKKESVDMFNKFGWISLIRLHQE